ncbi:protocatechuate 3,4-dioxygenase beta subunit [Nocardioides sp. BE266]|uniref:MSCRAMM family protein n=1 Tax=Nocardioides sp. BE266 TaxID=2817725 RepID=UPI002862B605|nr:carboxypeptidase-like regulatory domain-containing protein [Nocardioides sp. BE266]MDR7252063.1 protocatechuate 3,4-dioxygenase beta subunit [Nocardioides sp. BE266]
MQSGRTGAPTRLTSIVAAGALAAAAFATGVAAPANAAPVGVTTTLTDPAGNVLDGYVAAYALQADGSYTDAGYSVVADGVVSINVEPGTYKFFFSDDDNVFVSEYYNDKATFDTADPVGVTGPTTLAPVSLAARPTLAGQVISPSGKPIEDASIQVYNAADGTTETFGSTRADGSWVVGVDPGSYKVRFSASGYAFEYYSNKATLATADVVGAGANLGQVTLSKGGVVQGGITNGAGVPLERARATVYTTSGSQVGSDLTDATGNYRIEGVAPGSYRVQFTDPVGEYLSEWFNDKATLATSDPVDVGVDGIVQVSAALANDPDAAIDPATVDVSGTITDSSGAKVIGAEVTAYDTPADADKPDYVESVRTNRAGQYYFTRLSETSENAFKVQAVDTLDREEGQYSRLPRWFGGAQTYEVAPTVGKPAGAVDIALPLTGGVSGTVTSESALPVEGTAVRFFDEKGNPVDEQTTYVEDDGTYATTSLVPGTYKVQFIDFGYFRSFNTGDVRVHAPEWYDNTSFAKAKEIVVKSGQTVGGINAALSQDLRAFRKPEINGKPYLGGKVRAYPGVWALESGTTYTYQWLIGDTLVATGSTYKVTKAAKNKRLTLRVSAENGLLNGTAVVSSQVIKKKPKVKVAVKGSKASIDVSAKKVKAKKFKGKVVVKKIVRKDEYGAPVYKKVGKAKLVNGKARLTLKKLTKGKNKLVFVITLKGGKYGNAEVEKTVKLKR